MKKILVVEDEKPIAKALELKLKSKGYEVIVVFDGEDAHKQLESQDFDLVLTDLVMPVFDGFKLLSWIKEKGKNTPVLVLTNLSQEEDKEKVLALGAKGFFVKSNTPINDIVETVSKTI